ncbi:CBS domain-containing protein [Robiginitalea sp.]|jgi:predicted transcriptional regulator|nr:CBS domain-containing protein [Robiginitalea sp.]
MAIKSFIGRRSRELSRKAYNAPILVSDYMTRQLITFHADQSILEVMESFARNQISGGPVLDDNGFLVGIVSEADCMKQISESRYFNQPILEKSVDRFMSRNLETIPHDMSIFDAADMFHKNKRRRLPVLRDGILVGQISRKDIVIAALKLTAHNWK